MTILATHISRPISCKSKLVPVYLLLMANGRIANDSLKLNSVVISSAMARRRKSVSFLLRPHGVCVRSVSLLVDQQVLGSERSGHRRPCDQASGLSCEHPRRLVRLLSQAFNLAWPAHPRFGQLVQASNVTEQNLEERRR